MSKKSENYIIEGETTSGIKFRVDKRLLNDSRFLHYAVMMQDKNDKMKALKAMFEMYGLLFGSQEGLIAFENAVAEVNGGICSQEMLFAELNEILTVLKAKN